jgi:hypothetical protein
MRMTGQVPHPLIDLRLTTPRCRVGSLVELRGGVGERILGLGIVGEGSRQIGPGLGEIPLRLNHVKHGGDPELFALRAQLQAPVGQDGVLTGQANLIEIGVRRLVCGRYFLRNSVAQSGVLQSLCPPPRVSLCCVCTRTRSSSLLFAIPICVARIN